MKSITIHNFDDELAKTLVSYAKSKGTSLNQTVKELLKKSLGLTKDKKKADFSDLFGTWSKKEAEEVEKALAESERIDYMIENGKSTSR